MHSLHIVHLSHINLYAIGASALILWFLGATWYSPALFVKPWMKALGIDPTAARDGKKKGLALGMISSLVGDLLLAFVLWHMVAWAGVDSFGGGAFVGFLCWLGFFLAPNFPQGIYERRPFSLFAINTGYWLVGLLIAGGVLAVWQ